MAPGLRIAGVSALLAFCAAGAESKASPDVVVFILDRVSAPGPVMTAAFQTVSQTFAAMGIKVALRGGKGKENIREATAIRIQVCIENTPPGDHHAGVAYSEPFASGAGSIWIRYDRVQELVQGRLGLVPALLARVLAHEIAHVIEQSEDHAARGIMKAHWSAAEVAAMRQNPLQFTPDDVERIRHGLLAARGGRAEPGPPAPSGDNQK